MPEISPTLTARFGMTPRRAQVVMIAGPPNAGKSMLALKYVVQHNLPTLYISADTDESTTLFRALAMLTGDMVNNIESAFEAGAEDVYAEDLDLLSNVRFSFDPTPTMQDINEEVQAYEEVMGQPPHLVVVDNLLNVYTDAESGAGSWSGQMDVAQFLHHLARKSGAAVWILHHTSESRGNPSFPAGRADLINKMGQLPEVILTVALDTYTQEYRVSCVKNRSGTHDATGKTFITLYAEPDRMQLHDTLQEKAMAQSRREWQ